MNMANDPSPGSGENNREGQSPAAASTVGEPAATLPLSTPSLATPGGAAPSQQEELIGSWLSAHLYRADVPYQFLALALAFLLASFTAANPDVWMSLATGRLLAVEGKLTFDVDPFSYTAQASAWINHSWLFSWISYVLYHETGAILVIFKGLVVTGICGLLLLLRPRSKQQWAIILCVLLTVLTLSARVLLQPMVVSFLFLAATMFILFKAGVLAGQEDETRPRLLWALPPLFALWVNLDVWFVLGPLSLLICLLASAADGFLGRKGPVSLGLLGAVFAVSTLACLANPHHVHGLLSLPPELGYLLLKTGDIWPESLVAAGRTLSEFQQASRNFEQTLSAFSQAHLTQTTQGLNIAGMSFFVLLAVVLASFYFLGTVPPRAGPGIVPARLGLVVVLGILALMQVRLVPVFAVVAGTMAILNWQEYLSWRGSLSPANAEEQNLWGNLARLCTGFLLFGLFFLSWPGWIAGPLGDFSSPRRVAWSVKADPSMRATAEYLGKLHKEGKLHRGLNFSPQIASYCAWYAPGVKFYFDYRFQLFAKHIGAANEVQKALFEESGGKKSDYDWRGVFTRHDIDHIVATGLQEKPREGSLTCRLMRWSWWDPLELQSIYADGKTMALYWRNKGEAPRIPHLTEAWHKQAFGPSEADAEVTKLAALEEDPGFWRLYLFGLQRPPLATNHAELLLDYYTFRLRDPRWRQGYLLGRWIAFQARPAGLATGPLALDATLFFPVINDPNFHNPMNFNFQIYPRDFGPPEAPLLALRSLREAVAANPQNPHTYKVLVEASQWQLKQENHWIGSDALSTLRINFRKLQTLAAVKHHLLLQPNDYQGHWALGEYFLQQNFLDLALQHMQDSLKHLESIKSTNIEQYMRERSAREDRILAVEREVNKRNNDFELQTVQAGDLDKIAFALSLPYETTTPDDKKFVDPRGFGLVFKARDLLEKTPTAQLPPFIQKKIAYLRFRLALQTGDLWQLDKALPDFAPKRLPGSRDFEQSGLPPGEYFELMFFLKAALGDFYEADTALEELEYMGGNFLKTAVAVRIAEGIAPPFWASARDWPGPHLDFSPLVKKSWDMIPDLTVDLAEKKLVRGILALEMGNTRTAKGFFEESLKIAGSSPRFVERKLAERWLELLKAP